MQALRLVRARAPVSLARRRFASAAAHPGGAAPAAAAPQTVIPLSNVEAQWDKLSPEEQVAVHQQLEQLQKKDWKTLSIDEKKAAYYIAFGPHGPRTPANPPGTTFKILLGSGAVLAAAAALFFTFRALAPPPPRTLTKEWQEASNEKALEQKMNPITGIASEGYKGKGFVTRDQ